MVSKVVDLGVTGPLIGLALVLALCFGVVLIALRGTLPDQRPAILLALAMLFRAVLRRR